MTIKLKERPTHLDGTESKYSRKGTTLGSVYYADSRWINEQLGISDSYQAPDALLRILYDQEVREQIFLNFLHEYKNDVSYDWFTLYFQEEHADRKTKKQDFTPNSVATILSELTSGNECNNGLVYDAPAGTGGLLINKWNHERMKSNPLDYKPGWYLHVAEDLSDRAIPFLLFNVMVRGMNAVVSHCDVLTRESYGTFFIQNDKDDHLSFSNLNLIPYPCETPNKDETPLSLEGAEGCELVGGLWYRYTRRIYDAIAESKGADGDGVPSYLIDALAKEDYHDTPFADFINELFHNYNEMVYQEVASE